MRQSIQTTPESRAALRRYLQTRMMTKSMPQVLTFMALSDLEEALRLLEGAGDPTGGWQADVAGFLGRCVPGCPSQGQQPLPGLLDAV
ncbi:MAG: hypothetical protein H6Q00_3155 [Holophagaceae bacterium]|nr:hypothetical protein [Holophagaceae bacterium]